MSTRCLCQRSNLNTWDFRGETPGERETRDGPDPLIGGWPFYFLLFILRNQTVALYSQPNDC